MFSRNIGRCCFFLYLLLTLILPTQYKFMGFNLILAFIPYEISYLLQLFKPASKREWPLFLIVLLLWLLFLPNVFYVVTDLIHLNMYVFDFMNGLNLFEWIEFTYIVVGVLLALYFYSQVMLTAERLVSRERIFSKGLLLVSLMLLSSFGMYIGRFLRFHSVHILTQPGQIIVETLTSLNKEAVIWILMLTLLQAIFWLLLKGVRKL